MKKFSINMKGIWSSKVDFSNSIFWEMKPFMISFRSSDVQHILIDKLGLPAFCVGIETFLLFLKIPRRALSPKYCLKARVFTPP